jgi:hypothetical protein
MEKRNRIKRTLSVLLLVGFVLSVTAASASAHEYRWNHRGHGEYGSKWETSDKWDKWDKSCDESEDQCEESAGQYEKSVEPVKQSSNVVVVVVNQNQQINDADDVDE